MGKVSGPDSGNLEILKRAENITDDNDNITQKDVMMYRLPTKDGRDNNADNFRKTGYYYTSPETKNAADYGIINVASVPAPWITQTWHRLDGKIFIREYSNIFPKWSEWNELLKKGDGWKKKTIDKAFSETNSELIVPIPEDIKSNEMRVHIGIPSSNASMQLIDISMESVPVGFQCLGLPPGNYYYGGYIYRDADNIRANIQTIGTWEPRQVVIKNIVYR